MKPLDEGCMAITINMSIGNGALVTVGKHLGRNHKVEWNNRNYVIVEDLWEIPGVLSSITDGSSGIQVIGEFLPTKSLMRIDDPDLYKEILEESSVDNKQPVMVEL